MIKRLLLTGVALASLAVTSVINASPASADGTISLWNDTHQIQYGYGHFASTGEIFTACDTYADGRGVSVNWYVVANPSNHGEAYDSNGANNGCATSNATITEGRQIAYRVCRRDSGAYVFCSSYFYDYA
jgi:hypothetical protein